MSVRVKPVRVFLMLFLAWHGTHDMSLKSYDFCCSTKTENKQLELENDDFQDRKSPIYS